MFVKLNAYFYRPKRNVKNEKLRTPPPKKRAGGVAGKVSEAYGLREVGHSHACRVVRDDNLPATPPAAKLVRRGNP